MKTLFVTVGILLLTCQAYSGTLGVHTASVHILTKSDLNEFNFGINYEFDNQVVIGGFYNSFERPSFYLARDFKFGEITSIYVGAITGYRFQDHHVCGDSSSVLPLVAVGLEVYDNVELVWMLKAINLVFKF